MKEIAVDVLVGIAVLSAWTAALGFLRLRWSLDRLHAVAYSTMACGLPLVAAGFLADGPSIRAFKLLFVWLVTLIAGASLNQAVGRAIVTRSDDGEKT